MLESSRQSNTTKRFYTPEMLRRLEMILLLRELQFSMKEIYAILESGDRLATIDVFIQKLTNLLDDHEKLKLGVVHIGNAYEGNNKKEERSAMNQSLTKLQDHEVRFIEINPMKVSYYHTTIHQPEDEATKRCTSISFKTILYSPVIL